MSHRLGLGAQHGARVESHFRLVRQTRAHRALAELPAFGNCRARHRRRHPTHASHIPMAVCDVVVRSRERGLRLLPGRAPTRLNAHRRDRGRGPARRRRACLVARQRHGAHQALVAPKNSRATLVFDPPALVVPECGCHRGANRTRPSPCRPSSCSCRWSPEYWADACDSRGKG